MSRRKQWLRRTAVLVAVAGTVALGAWLPGLLRDTDAFLVTRVEVIGTRFADPRDVVAASGLDREANLFDDADAWRAGALTHPLIDEVRVQRSFPSTVVLEVREPEPVALVALETLRPVDASGRLLDLDPAGALLDLPLLTGADARNGQLVGASALAARTLAALLRETPELGDRVSQVRVQGSWIRLVFRDAGAEAVLPAEASSRQLVQLRLALIDLRARGELDEVRTIDVRYRDQVVVSFLETPVG